jgi:hypothetical protein
MSGGAAPTYRIFISSPGDVMEERARAQRTIARLNGEFQDELRMLTIAYEEKTIRPTTIPSGRLSRPLNATW